MFVAIVTCHTEPEQAEAGGAGAAEQRAPGAHPRARARHGQLHEQGQRARGRRRRLPRRLPAAGACAPTCLGW